MKSFRSFLTVLGVVTCLSVNSPSAMAHEGFFGGCGGLGLGLGLGGLGFGGLGLG